MTLFKNRVEALKDFCSGWHGAKLAKKITAVQFDELVGLVEKLDHLNHLEFEYAVNRWLVGLKTKTKNHIIMTEMAMSANTRMFRKKETA